MENTQKESSVVYTYVEKIKTDYYMASTTILALSLVIALVVLKKFIYISDDKRDDQ